MTFNGKVALVTGGASGMGRETALRMARRGARVAILDVNQKALAETAAMSANIQAFECDVSDLGRVRSVVAEVERTLGPIDRLVHCAAIMPGQSLRDMSAEAVFKVMAINYGGTVNMTKTLLPFMEKRGHGDIILYGSMAGDVLRFRFPARTRRRAPRPRWRARPSRRMVRMGTRRPTASHRRSRDRLAACQPARSRAAGGHLLGRLPHRQHDLR